MNEKWNEGDVRREYARQVDRDYQDNQSLDSPLRGLARLVESTRARRGTAFAERERQRMIHLSGRCAPVIRVDAGHIATDEAIRYVTLVDA